MKNRTVPFGYVIRNGKLTIESNDAQTVQWIFNQYMNGQSLGKLASALTEHGVNYYCGKTTWDKMMIKRILECTTYMGLGDYPMIISEVDFNRVREIAEDKHKALTSDANVLAIRKRIYCGLCCGRMFHDLRSKRYPIWKCSSCGNAACMAESEIFSQITGIFNRIIEKPELLDEIHTVSSCALQQQLLLRGNELNILLGTPGVTFDTAYQEILGLAALKYDSCDTELSQKLTETIKSEFTARQALTGFDIDLFDKTVSHITVAKTVTISFINGAVIGKGAIL